MPAPRQEPIGLTVATTAKKLSRAFDEALAQAGGSRPVWLVLLALEARRPETQRELAAAVGIEGATLTHHLDGMERAGLVKRERLPDNRRVQRVTLTRKGQEAFRRLREAAVAYDARLRDGLDEESLERMRAMLARMAENVASE